MSNHEVVKGDSVELKVTLTDSNGNPIDLDGYTVYFTAKENYSDSDDDAVIQKDVTSHTTPASGITTITLDSSNTNIDARYYYYDIQAKDAAGNIQTPITGKFIVNPQSTERTD